MHARQPNPHPPAGLPGLQVVRCLCSFTYSASAAELPHMVDALHVLDALLALLVCPAALPVSRAEAARAAHNCLVLTEDDAAGPGGLRMVTPAQVRSSRADVLYRAYNLRWRQQQLGSCATLQLHF